MGRQGGEVMLEAAGVPCRHARRGRRRAIRRAWPRKLATVVALAVAAVAARNAGAAIEDQITIGNTRVVVKTVIGSFEGELRVLQLEDDLYHNELIETEADSATKLVFLDETTLTLGPDSSVVLDRFVYDPDPSKASFVMTATKGIFRFASGKLPKNAYRLHTPAATIGIRGTVLDLAIDPGAGADGGAVVRIGLEAGAAIITPCGGEALVIEAGQTLELTSTPGTDCIP
jgi:hypothetical protein